jgi:hypothetical protein
MTNDNFCFYLQNRLIQTSQTGGQWYSDTSTFSIPCLVFQFYVRQEPTLVEHLTVDHFVVGSLFIVDKACQDKTNALAYISISV